MQHITQTRYPEGIICSSSFWFSSVKFVISGFEFGNLTIRHWFLRDRWHSCPNNRKVQSRCAKMFIKNISGKHWNMQLLHILQIIFTMLFKKYFLINYTSMYICNFCLVREYTCSFLKYSKFFIESLKLLSNIWRVLLDFLVRLCYFSKTAVSFEYF